MVLLYVSFEIQNGGRVVHFLIFFKTMGSSHSIEILEMRASISVFGNNGFSRHT